MSEDRFAAMATRMAELERRMSKAELDTAVITTQLQAIDSKFQAAVVTIEKRFETAAEETKEIKALIKWVNRSIWGILIAAVMAFIIRGGLNLV